MARSLSSDSPCREAGSSDSPWQGRQSKGTLWAEPDHRPCLLAELNISQRRFCRDHSLGQSPPVCLAKARTTLSCHQLASLGSGPLASSHGPGTQPCQGASSAGMKWPCNIFIGLGRLRWNCGNYVSLLRWGGHPNLSLVPRTSFFPITSHSHLHAAGKGKFTFQVLQPLGLPPP